MPESEEGTLDDTQPPLELQDDIDDDDDDYPEDDDDDDEGEEEDTASIVTVQASSDKLFLRSDSDAYGPSSIDSVSSQGGKVRIKAVPLTLHQTLAKETTIVEVLNPVIGGDGSARTIQVSGTPFDRDILLEQPVGAASLLHSETFVLSSEGGGEGGGGGKSEMSLNAKMKNVLEELLENERVKLNLQKSLEEHSEDEDDDDEGETIYVDARDDEESAYGDAMDDVVDFGITASPRDDAKNGNQQLLEELMRDSNRNTIIAKLASQLGDDDDEDDDEEEDDEDEESSDSSEEDSEDSDEEQLNVAYVQGAQVIENLNTAAGGKQLQKSQTYTTIKQAEAATEQPLPEVVSVATQSSTGVDTLAQLQAEQRALAEISKQLRKSVEDLLCADGSSVVETQRTYTLPAASDSAAVVTVTEVVKKQKKKSRAGAAGESGEAIFNRLLSAGEAQRQIFDQQQGETITTTTTTTEALPAAGATAAGAGATLLCEPSTSVVTTTRTVSNIVTSGIPRPEASSKQTNRTGSNNNNNNNNNRGKNKRKGKKK